MRRAPQSTNQRGRRPGVVTAPLVGSFWADGLRTGGRGTWVAVVVTAVDLIEAEGRCIVRRRMASPRDGIGIVENAFGLTAHGCAQQHGGGNSLLHSHLFICSIQYICHWCCLWCCPSRGQWSRSRPKLIAWWRRGRFGRRPRRRSAQNPLCHLTCQRWGISVPAARAARTEVAAATIRGGASHRCGSAAVLFLLMLFTAAARAQVAFAA